MSPSLMLSLEILCEQVKMPEQIMRALFDFVKRD